jgi:hypothetical protein
MTVAARAGRWSPRHHRLALVGWLAFALLASMIGSKVGTNAAGPSPVSNDGRSALVTFGFKAHIENATARRVVDASPTHTKEAEAAHPGFSLEQFGSGSSQAFMQVVEEDQQKATVRSLPATLHCCW